MAEEGQGFLGRWARRKTEVLQGKTLEEPVAVEKSSPVAEPAALPVPVKPAPAVAPSAAASPAEQPEKVLSLDDVKLLTRDSDFTPFMARNVGPDVRNAAMKKLFADPHYNVMDGLDIYIDDYSKSDPIPQAMLRQMVGAKLLKIFDDVSIHAQTQLERNLGEVTPLPNEFYPPEGGGFKPEFVFDEEDKGKDQASKEGAATPAPVEALPRGNLNNPTPETVAQSDESPDSPKPLRPEHASQHDHAHTHLRLQPDHAPPAPRAGHGTS